VDEREVERWVDEARVAEAADARSRRHWLRRQLDAEATLRGVLVEVAERDDPVTLTTTAGMDHSGRVVTVGADYLVLGEPGSTVLVPTAAVAQIRVGGRGPAGADRRPAPEDARRLTDVLADLAAGRERVVVRSGPSACRGTLVAFGQDVVTLTADGPPPATVYVSLASLSEVALLGG
jgi:hypothetical protein